MDSSAYRVLQLPELRERIILQAGLPYLLRYRRINKLWAHTIDTSPRIQQALYNRRIPRLEGPLTVRAAQYPRDCYHLDFCASCWRHHNEHLQDEHINPLLREPQSKWFSSRFSPEFPSELQCWTLTDDGKVQFSYRASLVYHTLSAYLASFVYTYFDHLPQELATGSWRDAYVIIPPVSRILIRGSDILGGAIHKESVVLAASESVRVGEVFDAMEEIRKSKLLSRLLLERTVLAIVSVVACYYVPLGDEFWLRVHASARFVPMCARLFGPYLLKWCLF
ncbi:hypothetical protein BU16DRAFT_141983 [Lophium mytilinum]|uniref:F-box domain-containing protein n=1 Tax=Lophium mytilinum TaxID=390894 RepID=A0A6A6QFT5_9PEZI|nr:hypothetical protein BU16DRAFT_141983 [Lophium mytilinum]